MNEAHLKFLASPEWARWLEAELLPWLLAKAGLGEDVLEIGPGPGLTTDLLRRHAARVTAVELDEPLAKALAARLARTNVEVLHADAADSGLASGRFSAVCCFSMLHHVPSSRIQDRLFAEVHRILRSSGSFVGTDARDIEAIRRGHVDDVFVPVDPETLPSRLEAVGFDGVDVEVTDFEVRFSAAKP